MEHILPLLDKVNQGAEVILEYLRGEVDDADRLLYLMQSRVALKKYLDQASALVNAMGACEDEFNATLAKLDGALDKLAKVIDHYGIHVDRGQYYEEVRAFLNERR